MRRESYDWLVNALELYCSYVFEFSKLQLTRTVLSKRKLIQLVTGSMLYAFLVAYFKNMLMDGMILVSLPLSVFVAVVTLLRESTTFAQTLV